MRILPRAVFFLIVAMGLPALTQASPNPDQQLAQAPAQVQTALENLKAAYATDEARTQKEVTALYEAGVKNLSRLHALLNTLNLTISLNNVIDPSGTTSTEDLIGREFKTWQIGPGEPHLTLFTLPLTPEDSKTVMCLNGIQKTIQDTVRPMTLKGFTRDVDVKVQHQAQRWESFFKNVTLQSYPWESAVNAYFDRNRMVMEIPRWQLKLGHPISGLVAYQGHATSSGTPLVGAEVIGVQWYDSEREYRPTWGISALFTFRSQAEASNGLGLMISYQSFKVGGIRHRLPDGRWNTEALISLNLAPIFSFRGSDWLKDPLGRLKQIGILKQSEPNP